MLLPTMHTTTSSYTCDFFTQPDFATGIVGDFTLKRIRINGKLRRFPGATATAVFQSSGYNTGSIGGSNGCNFLSGEYILTGLGEIEWESLSVTERACFGAEAKLERLF